MIRLFLIAFWFCGLSSTLTYSQTYNKPEEYELGPIIVDGADNFVHNALRAIAGLKQGDRIMKLLVS